MQYRNVVRYRDQIITIVCVPDFPRCMSNLFNNFDILLSSPYPVLHISFHGSNLILAGNYLVELHILSVPICSSVRGLTNNSDITVMYIILGYNCIRKCYVEGGIHVSVQHMTCILFVQEACQHMYVVIRSLLEKNHAISF